MGALRRTGRILAILLGLVLLAAGGLGWGVSSRPDHPVVAGARDGLRRAVDAAVDQPALGLPRDAYERAEALLSGAAGRFAFAPLGLVLVIGALLPGRGRVNETRAERAAAAGEARLRRKAKRQAGGIARKGGPLEAAEFCFENGLLGEAADYFIAAEVWIRAAEIRHDQNRFLECAELYLKGGRPDSAGSIFAQQGEHARAAECYLEAGNKSLAGEHFEKAGDFRRAAECYEASDFPRHAAQAYTRCGAWKKAAQCIEAVIREEGTGAAVAADSRKQAEQRKLVRMAGELYARAQLFDEAEAVLSRGGAHAAAAEIALQCGREARAAELFLEAKDVPRAAEILRRLGDEAGAARALAEFHRDKGEEDEAARHYEVAGEWMAAGDLYRLLERYADAASCYERLGEHAQAAEMFSMAGDRERAAAAWANAGRYVEAAECYALLGDVDREGELLTKAGRFLRAGEIHRHAGRDDDAIAVLQQIEAGSPDFPAASALLGEIFRERGQIPVALAKLVDAVQGQELGRENVGAFYMLATVHEANEELREAVDLYEKILAFDYHHADTQERLERAREALAQQEEARAKRAETASQTSPSTQSGRYQITGTLGKGGMGIVYKATDSVLDRVVALKVLPDSLKENPQALKNFLREAKSAAQLNHPNIVTVYDAGEQDGVFYIAMEYVDGNTLKEIVKRRGVISERGVVHVVTQLCEGLAYAHDKKIVHRDVKTANAMWTREKKAKIMDFGLAKVIEEVRNHTTVVSGTPYYMSPEQTLGKNVDHRTDIYSLGVTIFEMATGSLPFREGNLPYHHVHTPAPDAREFNPELSPRLAEIVARCLRKDPDERYASTRDVAADLKGVLGA